MVGTLFYAELWNALVLAKCVLGKSILCLENADVTSGNESIAESWKNSVSELESFFVFSFSHSLRLPGALFLGVRCLRFPLCPHAINECCFYREFESWWASVYVPGNSPRHVCIWNQNFKCISILVLNISDILLFIYLFILQYFFTCKQKEVYSVLPFALDVLHSNCLYGRDCIKLAAVSCVDTFIPDCGFSFDICTWILTELV